MPRARPPAARRRGADMTTHVQDRARPASPPADAPGQDAPALISLRGITRDYPAGDGVVTVLDGVDLDIDAGEMVAIVGASGSGKSTLMNILGCLDQPTRGSYRIAGRETHTLDAEALAELRREHFGFIFQRYNLLGDLSATGNVEVPAIYAGMPRPDRHERAAALLGRLGLAERLHHRPGQLSGGQQQRVSIARALMNGGRVIFADEPTGALDSRSGEEVMTILRELHAEGRTIILVTHDMVVAEHADRIIEISDGRIVADRRSRPQPPISATPPAPPRAHGLAALADPFREAFRMAVLAMRAHKLRTFLTMLGIIIGIASVVSVVAIGEGSRAKVLDEISGLGTNTIEIWAGWGWGDTRANKVAGLQASDSDALAGQYYLSGASPTIETTLMARYRGVTANTQLTGVGEQYFGIKGIAIAQGVGFDADSVQRRAQEVVIDQKALRAFFPDRDPIGEVMLIGQLPVRIVGVARQSSAIDNNQNSVIFAPYTTVQSRIVGRTRIRSLTMRVKDGISTAAAEQAVTHLLSMRRGTRDFYIANSDAIRKTMEGTARTMSLLISTIAVIALVVGGIGVMNIMLVSVTERTGEIGVRMAVGARRSDIMAQFLIEAVLVCLIGGALGVLLALGGGLIFGQLTTQFQMVFSATAALAAFGFSTLIGLMFGWLPARNAARLDPVRALSRE